MELNSLASLGRHYLETYYPSNFDEQAFEAAFEAVDTYFSTDETVLNISEMCTRYQLPSEVIENAAILFHLSTVASQIHSVYPSSESILLDMGGGPTLYQHLPLSLVVKKIIHVEPGEENQREIKLFLDRDSGAYDWQGYFRVLFHQYQQNQRFAALKNELMKQGVAGIQDWEEIVREKMREALVSGDVFSSNLESSEDAALAQVLKCLGGETCHVVTSNFVLESATDSGEKWSQGLDSLTAKVMPGGFLSMMAIRHANWYKSGEAKIPAYSVDEIFLQEELQKRGFALVTMRVLKGSDVEKVGYDGMVFILTRKDMA